MNVSMDFVILIGATRSGIFYEEKELKQFDIPDHYGQHFDA